jgi:hypothetical protein
LTICMLCLWLQEGYARFPTTARELHLVVALVAVGFLLTACLIRPLRETVRFLEQRKRPRAKGGRHLERASRYHPLALRGCDLRGVDLAGAFLADTDLSNADLRGVDFSGADLENVCLRNAIYDASTRWPAVVDPQRRGAIKVE